MDTPTFAREYPRIPPVIPPYKTPPRATVRRVIGELEHNGLVISSSGMAADVAMKWLRNKKSCYAMYWHAGFQCMIVIPQTAAEVEAAVFGQRAKS